MEIGNNQLYGHYRQNYRQELLQTPMVSIGKLKYGEICLLEMMETQFIQ